MHPARALRRQSRCAQRFGIFLAEIENMPDLDAARRQTLCLRHFRLEPGWSCFSSVAA